MDAHERLRNGTKAWREGRYAEALDEYVWFHEHALESQPSLYGVRLSFALMYWAELAMAYPPARIALREIRDRKVSEILSGAGNRDLFHDVVSINAYAFSDQATYDLFIALRQSSPAVAAEYASLALPAIVLCQDFQLARLYMPDPGPEVKMLSECLNRDVAELKDVPPSPAPRLTAYISNYVKEVKLFVAILRGVGEEETADQLQRLASELIETEEVRAAILSGLMCAEPIRGRVPKFGQN